MPHLVEQKLRKLGYELPTPPPAVAAYIPVITTGNLVMTSGQLPFIGKELPFKGKVGSDLSEEDGANAARLCALNALAQIKAAIGDLDRVQQIVRVEGYVQSASGFHAQPQVINGASLLIGEAFGDKGKHTRIAVGVSELPMNASVELVIWASVEHEINE
ncbi:MAG: RidA family protein [Planctomycetota bacterium]|nr:RidA family protein [Planctomycetota bacterium]MDA1214217.1 RidA family protein [Planctomycetota bacterium]